MNENVAQPQPAPVAQQPQTSGFAVTALVTGIVGLVFSWVPGLGVVLAAVAITFGALGWHYTGARGQPGKGMAIAGLTLGIIAALIFAILLIAAAGT